MPAPGAPDWMVTYGDMVTLLLCFFVLIVSFSEIKKEDEFQAVVEEIKRAFGMKGGGGKIHSKDDPELTFIQRIEALAAQSRPQKNRSNTTDPGMHGAEPMVTTIREGQLIAVGGNITFEPGSADLNDSARQQLSKTAELIRGVNNKILLMGHASSGELKKLDPDGRYVDLWDLSEARAKAVFLFMTSDQIHLRPKRFRLQSSADNEPLVQRVYTDADHQPNRRVAVLVSEVLVDELTGPASSGGD